MRAPDAAQDSDSPALLPKSLSLTGPGLEPESDLWLVLNPLDLDRSSANAPRWAVGLFGTPFADRRSDAVKLASWLAWSRMFPRPYTTSGINVFFARAAPELPTGRYVPEFFTDASDGPDQSPWI